MCFILPIREFPVEPYMRDAKLMEIGAGTNEILRVIIARQMLGGGSVTSGGGLLWHRVVSDFFVQGGDPDGIGYGDAGYSPRQETGPQYTNGAP